ncbi:PspC domain-containing protein [Streptomyces sp. NPDC002004]
MTDQQRAAASGAGAGPQGAAATADRQPGDPESAEAPRRFRRDRRHKMLGGVCAGLGRHCDMDPVIFRIVLAVLSVTGGAGLIFYGFAWLFVPFDDDEGESEARRLLTGRVDGPALAAILFALVGCGLFLSMLNNGGVLTFAAVLALLLAGAGYWSRHRGAADADPLAAQAVADAPPEAQAPPVDVFISSWWRDPIVKDGTHEGGTGYLWGPGLSREMMSGHQGFYGGSAREQEKRAGAGPAPGPTRRRATSIGGWVFLLALVAGGLGTGLTRGDHTLGTSLQTGLACALAVFGLGIAVSAFVGRTGAGSVVLAVLTAALLAGSAVLPGNITTRWVHADWTPAAAADVRSGYDLGTGVGTLDLSKVEVAGGRTVTTRAEVGAGQLKVVLPKDATVHLRVQVGVGDIRLPGDDRKDVDVAAGKEKSVTLKPPAGTPARGTVDLKLQVGVGQAEVSRAAS